MNMTIFIVIACINMTEVCVLHYVCYMVLLKGVTNAIAAYDHFQKCSYEKQQIQLEIVDSLHLYTDI